MNTTTKKNTLSFAALACSIALVAACAKTADQPAGTQPDISPQDEAALSQEMNEAAENLGSEIDDGHAGMADPSEIEAVKQIDQAVEEAKK